MGYNGPMRFLFFSAFILCLVSHAAPPQKAPTDPKRAVERLEGLVSKIRAIAAEADDEVARSHKESKQITDDAEAKAKKIREEADEYVKKIEREIEEIKKGMPGATDKNVAGGPTREQVANALANVAEPIHHCWAAKSAKLVESCYLKQAQQALGSYVKQAFPREVASSCRIDCR